MEVETVLDCGYRFKLCLPDRVFNRGPLVAPCPACGEKYIIYKDGRIELLKHKPFRFPALHY